MDPEAFFPSIVQFKEIKGGSLLRLTVTSYVKGSS
jgi:hypothetical protein